MLRISTLTEGEFAVTLRVEGVVAGDWVPLLAAEARRHLEAGQSVDLDLSWVSFLDREAVVMTRGLLADGVCVIGANALLNALLGEPGTRP